MSARNRLKHAETLLAAAFAAVSLAACGSSQTNWPQYWQIMRASIKSQFRTQYITRDQAAAIPYASLGYRINGGNEVMLVLATDNGSDQLWTSASHVVLMTRDGRIVRTVGLPHDRNSLASKASGPLALLSDALKGPYRSTRLVDFPQLGAYNMTLNCVTSRWGTQTISILGVALATDRIDETCQSAKPRWSFTDNYWIDAKTGFVWHSLQHLHPAGDTLQIEIFRPPE